MSTRYYTKFETIADNLLQNAKSNLEVGESYKYMQICRALKTDPQKTTKTQQGQLQRCFSRLFSYEKQGRNYLIQEIYDKVQPPIQTERKIRSDSPLTEWLKTLIISDKTTYDSERLFTEEFELTTNQCFFKFGMTNQMYYNLIKDKDFRKNFQKNYSFNEDDVFYFKDRIRKKYYQLLKSAFERLNSRNYIHYERIYKIGSSYNDLYYAEKEEIDEIKRCEEEVCELFGLDGIYQINDLSPHIKEDFKDILDEIQEKALGATKVIKMHKIVCLERAYKERQDLYSEDLNKIRYNVNQYLLGLSNKQAFGNIRHIDPSLSLAEKIEKKYGGYVSTDILNDPDVISNEWLLNQLLLADMFIKIKTSL